MKNNETPESGQKPGAPEPPTGYRPEATLQPQVPEPGNGGNKQPGSEFESARRMTSAAQIMALVSLVIGGVLLSTAALAVAVIAFRKTKALVAARSDMPDAIVQGLKRTGIAAVIMSALALGVNVAALIVLYPVLVEVMQTGDYSALLGGSQPSGDSSASFWG